MTILVKNTAISVERFIAAEVSSHCVKVYMDGLPTPHNYILIRTPNEETAKEVVKIIHAKMEKKA
jgi:hypothetical protein